MSKYIVILCTVPKKEVGVQIAEKLVNEKLVACVNVTGEITSIYRWKGNINGDSEHLLIIKSKAKLFDKIRAAIALIHPYKVPEIIALPIVKGSKMYLDWIGESTG